MTVKQKIASVFQLTYQYNYLFYPEHDNVNMNPGLSWNFLNVNNNVICHDTLPGVLLTMCL